MCMKSLLTNAIHTLHCFWITDYISKQEWHLNLQRLFPVLVGILMCLTHSEVNDFSVKFWPWGLYKRIMILDSILSKVKSCILSYDADCLSLQYLKVCRKKYLCGLFYCSLIVKQRHFCSVNHAQICSCNQPVLRNEGKVSILVNNDSLWFGFFSQQTNCQF